MRKITPSYLLAAFLTHATSISRIIPDEFYLKIVYKGYMNKRLNLDAPKTFNEKLQWLKIHDRNPLYTKLVDKYEVRKYIADTIGEEYLIPLVGGPWSSFNEIDFDNLPNQFVLKCNHDSGGLVICRDKSELNIEAVRKKIDKSLKRNFFWIGREWPYRNIKPCIIAEKYMVDESGYELKDYKIFSFDGEPKALFVACDRNSETEETTFDFYDMNFDHLPFTNGHQNSNKKIERPPSFEIMKLLASKLSKWIPQVRVDFYDINGKVYFGELTFSHWSGMVPFIPEEWDCIFGNWILLTSHSGGN